MNEVTLHRGRHPHLTVVDAYFDNQHLTEAVVHTLFSSSRTQLIFRLMGYYFRHRLDLPHTPSRPVDRYHIPKQMHFS